MTKSTLTQLREIVPQRGLTYGESLRIAELQAAKLLALSKVTMPPVAEEVVADLPRLQVRRASPFPASGASHWAKGKWQIVVNGSEAAVRQRFTMAHEFKHVIDHPFIAVIYPDTPGQKGYDRAEQVCDYFAACLLMPRAWVKNAYFNRGIQRLDLLARRFQVSQMAMRVRLLQLGIIESQPRCTPYRREAPTPLFSHASKGRIAA